MNKKGQAIIVKMMLAVLLFIAVIFLYPATNEVISDSEGATGLNCTSPALSTPTKATCIVLDLGLFYFIASCIAVGLAIITGRKTIVGVITAVTTTLIVVIMITPLKDLINLMRDADHLYCASTSLSVGQNMLCVFVDMWLFYLVAITIATAISYITLREFVPEETG